MSVKEAHGKALEFMEKKLVAIYPILAMTIILSIFIYPFEAGTFSEKIATLKDIKWDWLMLIGTPFGVDSGDTLNIPTWFSTALLLVGYIYTFLLNRKYDLMMFLAHVIGVVGYLYFTLNSPLILDQAIQMGVLNAGAVRAFAEMALGISLFMIYEKIKDKKLSIVWQILLSLLELYAIYRLFSLMFFAQVGLDNFRRIVYILIIVLLSFSNVTLFSRLANRRLWYHFGKITPAMCLTHYGIIMLYFRLLNGFKMNSGMWGLKSPFIRSVSAFLVGTSGYGAGMRATPVSCKDAVIYMALVVSISILILLFIAGVGQFYRQADKIGEAEKAYARSNDCRR